jgi:hypothetical protein
MKPLIDVRIADEELEPLAQGGQSFGPQLSRLLDDEMARFEAWMNKNLGGGLTRIERAAVKTYLYQKIVGRVDDLESRPIDVLEVATAKTG